MAFLGVVMATELAWCGVKTTQKWVTRPVSLPMDKLIILKKTVISNNAEFLTRVEKGLFC